MLLGILLVAGTFILLRKIETWLHQHIFKVGWLLTRNYRITTILYYTFFLPGVLLHEFTYWLVAGALNVSAERLIKWPEPQEVGELKLNFVRISPRTGIYRRAIITAAPLFVALLIIWVIANNVFDFSTALQIMGKGDLDDAAAGLRHLTAAPDFWLWAYIVFTLSNTMYPQIPKDLQGWRTIVGAVGIVVLVLFVVGVGNAAFQIVATPVSDLLAVFQSVLVFIIFINVVMTLLLGTAEALIERVTGYSATFKRGKMITMTREEAIAQRAKDRERQRKQQVQTLATTKRNTAADTGPKSVYVLMLPVPGSPDEEIVASPVFKVEPETRPALPDKPAISPRLGAEVITFNTPAAAPALPEKTDEKPQRPAKTSPGASKEPATKTTQTGEQSTVKAPTPEQVSEAVDLLKSKATPEPVTPDQVDDAVSTFKAASDSQKASAEPPAAEKPASPFNRPAAPFGTSKPASPFSTPQNEDNDDKDDLGTPPAAAKPASPFNRPAASFGTPKPASPFATPQNEDNDDKDDLGTPPAAAKPASPFNRPAAPFGAPKPASPAGAGPAKPQSSDLDDLPAPTVKPYAPFARPASPFSKAQDDDRDDPDSLRPPAAAKPSTPRPSGPFGPGADDVSRPANRPAFGASSVPSARPMSPFGPKSTDDKPSDSSSTVPRAPVAPSRFGTRPGTPFGTPAPKPASPFGRDDDDETLSSATTARDGTDDLFEDMGRSATPPTKRTTGMQPVVKAGEFGTSRPVPKKPLSSRSDDDEDEDLDTLRYEDEDPRYLDDEDVSLPDDEE